MAYARTLHRFVYAFLPFGRQGLTAARVAVLPALAANLRFDASD
jgi:hypothetical protein